MNSIFSSINIPLHCDRVTTMPEYPLAFHRRIDLIHILDGIFPVCIEGKNIILRKGDVAVTFPFQEHSSGNTSNSLINLISFTPDKCPAFEKKFMNLVPISPHLPADEVSEILPMLINNTIDYKLGDSAFSEETSVSYLRATVAELFNLLTFKPNLLLKDSAIFNVLMYCEENYTSDISIASVAKVLFVSPQYISYIFTQKLNCNFRSYINKLRIDKAEGLLKTTTMSITDIMLECGYKNQSTFNKVFSSIHSMTPTKFRTFCMNGSKQQ